MRNHSELAAVLRSYRHALAAWVVSALINVLYLTGSFFMLEVYDRVLPSRSMPTLVGLCDPRRSPCSSSRACSNSPRPRPGAHRRRARRALRARVYDASSGCPCSPRRGRRPAAAARSRPGPRLPRRRRPDGAVRPAVDAALSLHLLLFHPWIGVAALGRRAAFSIALTLADRSPDPRARQAPRRTHAGTRNGLAEAGRRNAEVVCRPWAWPARWARAGPRRNADILASQQQAPTWPAALGALSKVLRMILQSACSASAPIWSIQQEATAGIIIACSILMARALAPVELAIANWKGFVARPPELGAAEPAACCACPKPRIRPLALPAPQRSLMVESVSVGPPGEQRFVVQDVSLRR